MKDKCAQFKPLVKPDLSDICSMKAGPYVLAVAAASEDGEGPQKKARSSSEEEVFDEKFKNVATAMTELAPWLKFLCEGWANEDVDETR